MSLPYFRFRRSCIVCLEGAVSCLTCFTSSVYLNWYSLKFSSRWVHIYYMAALIRWFCSVIEPLCTIKCVLEQTLRAVGIVNHVHCRQIGKVFMLSIMFFANWSARCINTLRMLMCVDALFTWTISLRQLCLRSVTSPQMKQCFSKSNTSRKGDGRFDNGKGDDGMEEDEGKRVLRRIAPTTFLGSE